MLVPSPNGAHGQITQCGYETGIKRGEKEMLSKQQIFPAGNAQAT